MLRRRRFRRLVRRPSRRALVRRRFPPGVRLLVVVPEQPTLEIGDRPGRFRSRARALALGRRLNPFLLLLALEPGDLVILEQFVIFLIQLHRPLSPSSSNPRVFAIAVFVLIHSLRLPRTVVRVDSRFVRVVVRRRRRRLRRRRLFHRRRRLARRARRLDDARRLLRRFHRRIARVVAHVAFVGAEIKEDAISIARRSNPLATSPRRAIRALATLRSAVIHASRASRPSRFARRSRRRVAVRGARRRRETRGRGHDRVMGDRALECVYLYIQIFGRSGMCIQ